MKIDLNMTPKQMEVLNSDSIITIFSAGRGCGKTAFISLMAILNIMQGRRVLVIGPIFQQLKDSNYRQTLKFLDKWKLPYKVNKTELRIYFGKTGEIIHVSGEEPESIRSYTSIDVLIFDEAASLSEDCWKLAIPTMRDTISGKIKIYVVGTAPSSENHWMARLNKKKNVNTIFGSYIDNPYNGKDYIKLLEDEYKDYPDDFRQRELYGQFIFSGEIGSLFADFRIEANNEYIASKDYPVVCGLDVAGKGRDMTCAVISQNNQVLGIYMRKTANEIILKQFAKELYLMHGFEVLRYDCDGIGHLLTFDLPVTVSIVPVNFGGSGGERFANTRTAMYFYLRRKNGIFMHGDIYSEHGEALLTELRATLMKERENKKIGLVYKDEIKKRIGRSPDRADALVLSQSHVEIKHNKPRIAPLVFGRR